jgi:hypothetical protein
VAANEQLDRFVRRERLRTIRNWCTALGLAAFGAAALPMNTSLITNPKAWAPTGGANFFVAPFLFSGWLALLLAACGVALLVAALFLTVHIGTDR